MGASGEQAQHPGGIGRIARFAENSAIHYDDSIRPQNEIIRTDAEHSFGFFARDRKSTRLNSSHSQISYAVFCLKKKNVRPMDVNPWVNEARHAAPLRKDL